MSYYHIFLLLLNAYDFNDSNNIKDILYNTNVIISIVKWFVHSLVDKFVSNKKSHWGGVVGGIGV